MNLPFSQHRPGQGLGSYSKTLRQVLKNLAPSLLRKPRIVQQIRRTVFTETTKEELEPSRNSGKFLQLRPLLLAALPEMTTADIDDLLDLLMTMRQMMQHYEMTTIDELDNHLTIESDLLTYELEDYLETYETERKRLQQEWNHVAPEIKQRLY